MKTETIIKEDNHQKISVISDDTSETKYIERHIYDDKRELYKILQTVKHPNLIQIYDIDFDTETIIREEYIDAVPLSDFMENGHLLTKAAVKKISVQLASAMEALHGAQIIHRDIKPDNILINQDLHVWLIDYDIARICRPEIKQDTDIRGTFGYAPIEQYGMMPTDFKTDIYAFGVTLSKLLKYSGVKGSMNKIAEKCKRLDPSERYESAKKLKKALANPPAVWVGLGIGAVLIAMILFAAIYIFGSDESGLSPGRDLTNRNATDNPAVSDGMNYENSNTNEEQSSMENTDEKSVTDMPADTQSTTKISGSNEPDIAEDTAEKPQSDNTQWMDNIPHNQNFVGFKADATYQKYVNFYNFSDVMFFKTSNECNHMLMLEDGEKSGKIRLGGTFVDASFNLSNGTLSATLTDDSGRSFNRNFNLGGNYSYDKIYTSNLIKTADMICADISSDGNAELIIGLGEGVMGISEGVFFSDFNYCVAWCVSYNTSSGFKPAKGNMFSRGTFFVDAMGNVMPANSGWGDEPYIYYLEEDSIVGLKFPV